MEFLSFCIKLQRNAKITKMKMRNLTLWPQKSTGNWSSTKQRSAILTKRPFSIWRKYAARKSLSTSVSISSTRGNGCITTGSWRTSSKNFGWDYCVFKQVGKIKCGTDSKNASASRWIGLLLSPISSWSSNGLKEQMTCGSVTLKDLSGNQDGAQKMVPKLW